MADTKISALSAAGALTGDEQMPAAQSGASVQLTLDDLAAYFEGELPSFFAVLRGLSPGDDAPLNTFASDLAAYVTGIDQAQEMLDAAAALGSATDAIERLEGPAPVPTYADLAAVIAAIAATTLAEGDPWRIAWTGDTYLGSGEVIGFVRRGAPSWGDMLPGSKLGTTYSTVSSAGAGARSTDGAGRLLLTVGASDTDEILADLGFAGRAYRRAVQAVQYTTATPGAVNEILLQTRLASVAGTSWLGPGLRYFGSWALRLDASAGSTSPLSPSPAISVGAFAAGARVDFEMSSGPDFTARSFGYKITQGTSVAESTTAFAQPAGLGDWRTSVEVRNQLKLASSGTAGQAVLIGLLCEI